MPCRQITLSEINNAIEKYVETRMKRIKFPEERHEEIRAEFRNWMKLHIRQQIGLKSWKHIREKHLATALQIIEQEKIRFT